MLFCRRIFHPILHYANLGGNSIDLPGNGHWTEIGEGLRHGVLEGSQSQSQRDRRSCDADEPGNVFLLQLHCVLVLLLLYSFNEEFIAMEHLPHVRQHC